MDSDSGSNAIYIAFAVGLIGLVFAILKSVATSRVKANAAASRLVFVIGKTESLDDAFGRGPGMRIVAPDGAEVEHLNKCNIGCTNVGADTIKDLKFDVLLPGTRKYVLADFKTTAKDIASGATYSPLDSRTKPVSSGIKIALPFLNSKESLPLSLWFDGPADKCEIKCRLANVNCTVKRTDKVLNEYVRDVGSKLAAAAPAAVIMILGTLMSGKSSSGDSDSGA
jgi:hypothetical protein